MHSATLVVTRPSGQADALIQALHQSIQAAPECDQKQRIIALPLLTIAPRSDAALGGVIRESLRVADLAVFVSPNAIECTMRLLGDAWQSVVGRALPIGVVGQSSYQALERHGIGVEAENPTPIWMPSNPAEWDSEGLWDAIKGQFSSWAGRKVVLLRGDGGREWLAEQLQSVGATVEAIGVYNRVPLAESSPLWREACAPDAGHTLWLLTSSEAVRHLGAVLKQSGSESCLQNATALCSHHNIANTARDIGFTNVLQCHSGDAALIRAAVSWLGAESKKPR